MNFFSISCRRRWPGPAPESSPAISRLSSWRLASRGLATGGRAGAGGSHPGHPAQLGLLASAVVEQQNCTSSSHSGTLRAGSRRKGRARSTENKRPELQNHSSARPSWGGLRRGRDVRPAGWATAVAFVSRRRGQRRLAKGWRTTGRGGEAVRGIMVASGSDGRLTPRAPGSERGRQAVAGRRPLRQHHLLGYSTRMSSSRTTICKPGAIGSAECRPRTFGRVLAG